MRVCELTGKRRLVGYNVSHAHNKTKKRQQPNIQWKRIWLPEEGRYIRVRASTRALRSVAKLGFRAYCKKNDINYDKFIATH